MYAGTAHKLPRTPTYAGETISPVLVALLSALRERTNNVVPAAAPMSPKASPTLATVCCVLPDETSSALLAGHGPPPQAALRSSYVERDITPATANVTRPAAATP